MNILVNFHVKVGKIGWRLFLLNTYWILFTLLGLVVFGFAPATNAIYKICLEIEEEPENDRQLFKRFYKIYREQFFKSNKKLFPCYFILLILSVDITLLRNFSFTAFDGGILLILELLMIAVILLMLNILWLSQFELSYKEVMLKSIILLIGKPSLTMINALVIVILLSLYYTFLGLIIVFGIASLVFIQVKYFYQKKAFVYL